FMNHQNTVCMAGWLQHYQKAKKKDPSLTECEYLRDWIDNRVNAEGKDNVTSDRGVNERYRHNTEGGGPGPAGHPLAPIPAGQTMNSWQNHNVELKRTQDYLKQELKDYEARKCSYEGASTTMTKSERKFVEAAREAADRPLPTAGQWTGGGLG